MRHWSTHSSVQGYSSLCAQEWLLAMLGGPYENSNGVGGMQGKLFNHCINHFNQSLTCLLFHFLLVFEPNPMVLKDCSHRCPKGIISGAGDRIKVSCLQGKCLTLVLFLWLYFCISFFLEAILTSIILHVDSYKLNNIPFIIFDSKYELSLKIRHQFSKDQRHRYDLKYKKYR